MHSRPITSFGAAALLIAAGVADAAAGCEPGKEIWAGDVEDGVRTIAYSPGELSSTMKLVFEGWRGATILWRVTGEQACSNGVVFCFASIPMQGRKPIEAPIEEIREDDSPRYLVLAQLRQATFRAQAYDEAKLSAQWFAPEPVGDGSMIVLPSVYRFLGCQKGDELEAGSTP